MPLAKLQARHTEALSTMSQNLASVEEFSYSSTDELHCLAFPVQLVEGA